MSTEAYVTRWVELTRTEPLSNVVARIRSDIVTDASSPPVTPEAWTRAVSSVHLLLPHDLREPLFVALRRDFELLASDDVAADEELRRLTVGRDDAKRRLDVARAKDAARAKLAGEVRTAEAHEKDLQSRLALVEQEARRLDLEASGKKI